MKEERQLTHSPGTTSWLIERALHEIARLKDEVKELRGMVFAVQTRGHELESHVNRLKEKLSRRSWWRFWLLLLPFLLITTAAHAEPFSPAIQLLYPKGRDHRAVWRAAMKPFRHVGIRPRLVKLVPLNIARATGTGINLYAQFLPLAQQHQVPGVRTLVLVPPAAENPTFTGISDIGGPVSICVWTRPQAMSATCIAHELGHSFGAHHTPDGLMDPVFSNAKSFSLESVAEMVKTLTEKKN